MMSGNGRVSSVYLFRSRCVGDGTFSLLNVKGVWKWVGRALDVGRHYAWCIC